MSESISQFWADLAYARIILNVNMTISLWLTMVKTTTITLAPKEYQVTRGRGALGGIDEVFVRTCMGAS